MLFGVRGAPVSGGIAAVAFDDMASSGETFRRHTASFKRAFAAKRCFDLLPLAARRHVMRSGLGSWLGDPERTAFIMDAMLRTVPGHNKV